MLQSDDRHDPIEMLVVAEFEVRMHRENIGKADVFPQRRAFIDEIEIDMVGHVFRFECLNFHNDVIVLLDHGSVIALNVRFAARQTQQGRLNEHFRCGRVLLIGRVQCHLFVLLMVRQIDWRDLQREFIVAKLRRPNLQSVRMEP